MNLDEKALEAAWDTLPHGSTLISRRAFKIAISTYLSSLPSSPVSELADVFERFDMDPGGFLGGRGRTVITIGDLRAVRRALSTSPQGGEHE